MTAANKEPQVHIVPPRGHRDGKLWTVRVTPPKGRRDDALTGGNRGPDIMRTDDIAGFKTALKIAHHIRTVNGITITRPPWVIVTASPKARKVVMANRDPAYPFRTSWR